MGAEDELPDFGVWKTGRLEFILVEYRESLDNVKAYYGAGHQETKRYERWVGAIEAELESRKKGKR
jgi:hypothetical protein